MSAYLCANDTFDYLGGLMRTSKGGYGCEVFRWYDAAGRRWDGHSDTDALLHILRAEHIRSLQARYPGAAEMWKGDYVPRPIEPSRVDPIVALKSIACLRYQSCEADDYQTTEGARLLDALESWAIHRLPGFDEAPWGWTRPQGTVTRVLDSTA